MLALASGDSPEDFFVFFHRSSDLAVAEYVALLTDTASFGSSASLFLGAGVREELDGGGPVTVFLPFSEVLEDLPDHAISSDLPALRDLLLRHIVAADLPPYELLNHESLTALNGDALTLEFSETRSSLWEIGGAPIWWDVRLANGVLYAIGDLSMPLE